VLSDATSVGLLPVAFSKASCEASDDISNRKLYDTQESHYVTLAQIASIIRAGDDIKVLDKDTGRDLTAATMALIIFEEEKRGPKLGGSWAAQDHSDRSNHIARNPFVGS
jgi:hypothetical protein